MISRSSLISSRERLSQETEKRTRGGGGRRMRAVKWWQCDDPAWNEWPWINHGRPYFPAASNQQPTDQQINKATTKNNQVRNKQRTPLFSAASFPSSSSSSSLPTDAATIIYFWHSFLFHFIIEPPSICPGKNPHAGGCESLAKSCR